MFFFDRRTAVSFMRHCNEKKALGFLMDNGDRFFCLCKKCTDTDNKDLDKEREKELKHTRKKTKEKNKKNCTRTNCSHIQHGLE